MQAIYTIFYKYNLLFYVEHHALLSIIGLFQIFQMIPVLSAILLLELSASDSAI